MCLRAHEAMPTQRTRKAMVRSKSIVDRLEELWILDLEGIHLDGFKVGKGPNENPREEWDIYIYIKYLGLSCFQVSQSFCKAHRSCLSFSSYFYSSPCEPPIQIIKL